MKNGEDIVLPCSPSCEEFLAKQNAELRRAGCKMAEASLYVAREYDGVHRLMLAVSEWARKVADEGGRGESNNPHPINGDIRLLHHEFRHRLFYEFCEGDAVDALCQRYSLTREMVEAVIREHITPNTEMNK